MENDNTVQDDKPGEKSNSQIRLDDSGDDSDVSDYSTDSRETIPSVINSLHEFMYNNQGVVFDTHTSSSDIDKDSEVNSTEDVDSIACSSGTQHNYDDPHNVPMLQEKKDYFDTVTGSELNVPKQESADISPEVNLIHILKQSENETVNEMLVLTAEYQLSTDDPEFDENKTLQNCVQNKQIPETDSQLPLPTRNDEIESNECTSMDVTYSNAKDQKIPLACSTSHIFNLFSDLSLETQGQANDNLDDKLPNSVKSEEMCNSTSHSSDVSPVAVCDNTSIGAFPSSIFTKHMSFVSADDKPKVSFSFPSSTGPDLSFEINKAFSNLPASKNTFHVKTSSNSDGPFKFKISTLNNGNYSLDSVCKIMPSTSTSNIQNPVPVNSANDGASSLSFLSTLSPSASKHTETSTDMNNFQYVNSPDSRANNVSQCCQTTSQSMNTFSTTSQHHFRPFSDTFLKPDTGKCLSLFDKTPDGNSTNSFAGFSSTTTSPISSSPVFHFTNQSDIAKVLRRRAIRSPPKSAFEFCAQNNKLQISSSSGVNKNKPNFCFGSMEQQTSKKANAETRLGSFGAGLFGDNNEPNLSIGSIEQQTSKKSNTETVPGSFGAGLFGNSNKPSTCGSFGVGLFGENNKPNLSSGSIEQQTSKKSNTETVPGSFGAGLFGNSNKPSTCGSFGVGLFGENNKPNLSSGSIEQQTSKKSNTETVPGSFGAGLFGNSNKPSTCGSFGVGLFGENNKPNLSSGSIEQQTSKKSNTETVPGSFGAGLFGNSNKPSTCGSFGVGLFGENNKPNLSSGSIEQQTSKKSNTETVPGSFGAGLFGNSNMPSTCGSFGVGLFGENNKPNLSSGSIEQQTSKKSNTETVPGSFGAGLFGNSNKPSTSGSFGVGLFGENNKPNLSSGSIEQTSKKSNAETTLESFHFGSFGTKPNLCSGWMEQQTNKQSNAGTTLESFRFGSFGNSNKPNTTSGSFGDNNRPSIYFGFTQQQRKVNADKVALSFGKCNNKPNLSFGSTEQETSRKSNAETASGSFGVGLFVNSNNKSTFGSTEEQTSKNSTMWNAGSNFESQNTTTMFKFGDTCKFPNGTFYGQRPEKFEPRSERGWTSPVCSESGDTSNKPEIPFRVARGSEVVVKNGVVKTIEVRHQHITAMHEYSSLSFEELRFQHNKYNGKPYTATCTTKSKRTQTTDNSLVIEKYLNKMWKVLECPVCLEITTPPILQCEQGHHVCSNCWEKVPSCPLCKRRKSKSRNYVAEALVEKFPLPCRYRVDGCMTTVSLTEKRNHEDLCAYRTCLCLADGCNHACNFKAMTVHLKDAHSQLLSGILFCASKREKFSWTLLKPVLQSLVHAFDIPDWGLFLLRQRRALPNTYIWMEIMRFDASDTGFCYTVEASDSTQVRSITYKGLVLPLNSDTQDCLVIPRHYVNNLRHDAGFCLKISIWRSQS